jgi:hypothetical protein
VYRHAEDAALEVPKGDVDDAEKPDRELLGAIELPEAVPEPFAAVGALADELLSEDTVDDVAEHRPTPLVVGLAHRAVVGRDPEDSCRPGRSGPAKASPPGEWRRDRRKGNQVNVDRRDVHRELSSYE